MPTCSREVRRRRPDASTTAPHGCLGFAQCCTLLGSPQHRLQQSWMHVKWSRRHTKAQSPARAARGRPGWRGPAGSQGRLTSSTLNPNKPHLGGCAAASASAPPSPPSSGAAGARPSPSAASPAGASRPPASPPGAPARSAAGAAPGRGGLGQGLGAGGRSHVVARVLWSMKKVRPLAASLRACAAAADAHRVKPASALRAAGSSPPASWLHHAGPGTALHGQKPWRACHSNPDARDV